MTSKQKAAVAELAIAQDLTARGHSVALPFGEFGEWDLIVERRVGPSPVVRTKQNTALQKVQVKYSELRNGVIEVRNRCHSVTAGRVQHTYTYNDIVDWIAVYEPTTKECYYIPASALAGEIMYLRVTPAKRANPNIRWAKDYQFI